MLPNKESGLDRFSNEELAKMHDYADDHGGYAKGFPHGQIGEELNRRNSPPTQNPPLTEMNIRDIRIRQRHVDNSTGMRGIGRGRSNR